MTQKNVLRIVICDENDFLRMGLATFIESYSDMVLVGEANSGEGSVQLCAEAQPDVVLIDLNMTVDGMNAIPQIKQQKSDVWIVLLTMEHDMERIQAALDAGADRYLPKTALAEEVAAAIRGSPKA